MKSLVQIQPAIGGFYRFRWRGQYNKPGGYNILDSLINNYGLLLFRAVFPWVLSAPALQSVALPFLTIGAVIQAYKTDQEVSILSTPQIMTLDNEEAEINVGSNVPYITSQQSSSTATISTTTTAVFRSIQQL